MATNNRNSIGTVGVSTSLLSTRLVLAVLACTTLASCIPMSFQYQRIEASGARYFQSSCHASVGPPSVVYYPYHGIFISLDITNQIALGLHLPAGTDAQLNNNMVHISGIADGGSVDVNISIRAAVQGSLGSIDPPEFRGLRDPFLRADNFGPLTGESKNGRYMWYLFISETDSDGGHVRVLTTPHGLLRGTVVLPTITINGQPYGPQTLRFERRSYRAIAPVNC